MISNGAVTLRVSPGSRGAGESEAAPTWQQGSSISSAHGVSSVLWAIADAAQPGMSPWELSLMHVDRRSQIGRSAGN